MRIPLVPKSALIASAVAAVSACVSVLPEQPKPDAVYRLDAPSGDISLDAVLIVREPEASRLIAGRHLVSEAANSGLQVVKGVAWMDRVTRLLQTNLVDSFNGSGAGYAIDDSAGVSGDYELHWRVADLTVQGLTARCHLKLTLLDGSSRLPVAQWSEEASLVASGNSAAARIQGLARAAETCVNDAALRIEREVEARS
ncbi:MAG: hypothetical protein VX593_00285 [Pseudomonadota bacterium]|nr:hypothetical protein [Pseudomonadota bacterium]